MSGIMPATRQQHEIHEIAAAKAMSSEEVATLAGRLANWAPRPGRGPGQPAARKAKRHASPRNAGRSFRARFPPGTRVSCL